ncbi:response regulator [Wenyingzhuangia sp. chi5]|uniref:Response regulator n=2 Tax=Wenyingzhuangia gilva TaxID=3057677 RepID=A0ABT8VTA8_9FLAO|nr:response regulator [Wenyingzhuangia sp. chi5]
MNMSFILIDDDNISNFINERMIRIEYPDAEVVPYTNPIKGLEFISTHLTKKYFLFLDINMPEMTGWEFIEQINQADINVKENLQIYMLSSSVEPSDLERVKNYDNIVGFIEKPLNSKFLVSLKN